MGAGGDPQYTVLSYIDKELAALETLKPKMLVFELNTDELKNALSWDDETNLLHYIRPNNFDCLILETEKSQLIAAFPIEGVLGEITGIWHNLATGQSDPKLRNVSARKNYPIRSIACLKNCMNIPDTGGH